MVAHGWRNISCEYIYDKLDSYRARVGIFFHWNVVRWFVINTKPQPLVRSGVKSWLMKGNCKSPLSSMEKRFHPWSLGEYFGLYQCVAARWHDICVASPTLHQVFLMLNCIANKEQVSCFFITTRPLSPLFPFPFPLQDALLEKWRQLPPVSTELSIVMKKKNLCFKKI